MNTLLKRLRELSLTTCLWIGAVATQPLALAETLPVSTRIPETTGQNASIAVDVNDASLLLAQSEPVEVINVEIEETAAGLVLRLETAGEVSTPVVTVSGNAAIANISNAVLNLPTGKDFLVSTPAEGIALVSVSELPGDRVQIAVTGADAPPAVNFQTATVGLVANVAVGEARAQTSDDDAIRLTVTGDQIEDDYFVPNTSTATRTETPILDVPASIQIIPSQVIEDQQAVSIEEAVSNLSGIAFGGTRSGLDVDFTSRGFNEVPILRDGFRQFGAFNDGIPEIAHLERIEVLRGPASILYGDIQPGGLINLVSKQPLSQPFAEVTLQMGNRNSISPQVDVSGPITEDGRARYRLNALLRSEESFRDFNQNIERFFVAPIVTWAISDRTDLTFQLEYSDYEAPSDAGLPAVGNEVADVPFSRITGESNDFVENEFTSIGYDLEHRFNNSWQLRNAFRLTRQEIVDESAFPLFVTDSIVSRGLSSRQRNPKDFALQTSVTGELSTGPVDHTLLFGVDLNRTQETDLLRVDLANLSPLDIFNPVYGAFDGANSANAPIVRDTDIQSDRLGIYLQDQIDFFDNLILLAGIRYDTVEQSIDNGPSITSPAGDDFVRNDDAWTPRLGLVYQPIPSLSLYGSYSQSFVPSSPSVTSDISLEPERGEGFEIGAKAELFDGNLLATLAYFDITKQNVATTDPNDAFSFIATGEQQSRGIEFDLTGEILPGWNVIASYAYIDAEVTEDSTIPTGNRLFNAPEHSASLWTRYEVQQGDLQGLGIGIGFNFVGERAGDLANSFDVDSYFLTNAGVSYERGSWRAAVNVRNLFDVDYIESTRNSRAFYNQPGDPFTIIGSVSVQF
ncbi:MAG: TonB-dependent siderophore receptor [Phormidesmis sp.]